MRVTEIRTKEDAKKVIIEQMMFFVEEGLLGRANNLTYEIESAIELLIDANSEELSEVQVDLLCSFSKVAQARNAMLKLSKAFEYFNRVVDPMQMEFLSERYPFSYSFDELASDVAEWCTEMIENLDNLTD